MVSHLSGGPFGWSQLRKWWRRLADVVELEAVPWWVPVSSGGDVARAIPPTITWQARGAAPMLRLGPKSELWRAATEIATSGALLLVTIAHVPIGARVVIAGEAWQVREVRRRGPKGSCRLLMCDPSEVPS